MAGEDISEEVLFELRAKDRISQSCKKKQKEERKFEAEEGENTKVLK